MKRMGVIKHTQRGQESYKKEKSLDACLEPEAFLLIIRRKLLNAGLL